MRKHKFRPTQKASGLSELQESINNHWHLTYLDTTSTATSGGTVSSQTVGANGRTSEGSVPTEFTADLSAYIPKPSGVYYYGGDCNKPAMFLYAPVTYGADEFTAIPIGGWSTAGINLTPIVKAEWSTCNNTNQGSILCINKCDETSSGVVSFVKLYYQVYDGANLVSTFIGDYTDSSATTAYTITLEKDCNIIGTELESGQFSTVINGTGAWSPSGLTRQYTVRAISGTPTFTDSSGNITNLDSAIAETLTYPASQADEILDTDVVFNANGGEFKVSYIEYKTI